MRPLIFHALLVAAATVAAAVLVYPAKAQTPVFDAARALDFVQEFAKLKEQLDTAKSQLGQAQQMYESMTGSRGFGDVLRDGNLEQYLPQDARALYDGSGGGAGITASIQDILRREQESLSGAVPEVEGRIAERARSLAATEKALGQRAYDGAQARLEQIEALLDQIGQTQDAKGAAELQARIAGEQAAIQVELTKLQLVAQLQEAEARLAAEQRRGLSRRILSPANRAMPGVKSQ